MSAIKVFERERIAMLRSLDETAFDKFARRWKMPQPAQWAPKAKLASMHKARLQLDAFTSDEKATSRKWLAANGFTEEAGTKRACPQCGFAGGFSASGCPTCGVAQ